MSPMVTSEGQRSLGTSQSEMPLEIPPAVCFNPRKQAHPSKE